MIRSNSFLWLAFDLLHLLVIHCRSPALAVRPLLLLTVGEDGKSKRAYQIDKCRQQEHNPPLRLDTLKMF